jgi:transposase
MNESYVLGIDPGKKNFSTALLRLSGERVWKSHEWSADREGFEACEESLKQALEPGDHLIVGVEATASLDDNLLAWLGAMRAPFALTTIRVNCAQTARFTGPRPIRGKTDPLDADRRIAEFTRVYAAQLHRFEHDPKTLAMGRLVNERQRLVKEATATKNRLSDRLVISFPEFTTVFAKPWQVQARAVLAKTPTARHAARKRPSVFARFNLGRGRPLGAKRAKALISAAKASVASATSDFDAQTIRFMLEQLTLLEGRIGEIEAELGRYAQSLGKGAQSEPGAEEEATFAEEIRLAASMRGVGLVGSATLVLRARGLSRFTTAKALSAQLGACPDLRQTGSSMNTSNLTSSGDRHTRPMLYLLTQMVCVHDPAFAFHKWRLIRKGLKPKQAVCACMNRVVRILWKLAKTRKPYDVEHALRQIEIHHSELWKTFAKEKKDDKIMWRKTEKKWRDVG